MGKKKTAAAAMMNTPSAASSAKINEAINSFLGATTPSFVEVEDSHKFIGGVDCTSKGRVSGIDLKLNGYEIGIIVEEGGKSGYLYIQKEDDYSGIPPCEYIEFESDSRIFFKIPDSEG